jgi:hypothetical protein
MKGWFSKWQMKREKLSFAYKAEMAETMANKFWGQSKFRI